MFKVLMLDYAQVLFSGNARSVILPGERGVFEILNFHSPIVSMLNEGDVIIDGEVFPIRRGIVNFYHSELIALVER